MHVSQAGGVPRDAVPRGLEGPTARCTPAGWSSFLTVPSLFYAGGSPCWVLPGSSAVGREARPFLSSTEVEHRSNGERMLEVRSWWPQWAPCPGLLWHLHHSGTNVQCHGHCEVTRRSLRLRSVQLRQTKLCRTNSISLDLLASVEKQCQMVPDGSYRSP